MRRKIANQITKIIDLCLIYIGIDQRKYRSEKYPEEEDAEVNGEDSAEVEDKVSIETSTEVTTKIRVWR